MNIQIKNISIKNIILSIFNKYQIFNLSNLLNKNINFIAELNSNIYNNVIERFKKGHKIKIKKENKGKFTKWCKGKVTDKCIKRGKDSPNSNIRKRAIFADNARHFKH